MPNSVVTPRMEYNETSWIVSHVNLREIIPGHSALIIEGVLSQDKHAVFIAKDSKRKPGTYILQTDIKAIPLGKQNSLTELSLGSIANQTGVISEVRLFEYTENDYSRCVGAPSYYVQSQRVIQLIEEIEREQAIVNEFWQRYGIDSALTCEEVNSFIKENSYQTYGNHLFFGNATKGINCTEWCNNKLKVLGISPGLLENNMPKPKISAGQCLIL